MATINYNGIELQSIDECKVFEEPQEMLVWNTNYSGPIEKMVCAIIPYRNEGRVITRGGAYQYCAEIPKKPAPRRATNRELAKWLAQGKGEAMEDIGDAMDDIEGNVNTAWEYSHHMSKESVRDCVKVRKWDDTEWHEPDVEYMGLGE